MPGDGAQERRTSSNLMREGRYSERSENCQEHITPASPTGLPASDAQRAGTTNRILEQFEREDFAHRQITEPRPLVQIAPVEEDVAAIGKPDEAVSLPQHQRHDAARARRASLFAGSPGWRLMVLLCHSGAPAQSATQVFTFDTSMPSAQSIREHTKLLEPNLPSPSTRLILVCGSWQLGH